jgi:hypothetical protein
LQVVSNGGRARFSLTAKPAAAPEICALQAVFRLGTLIA